jgi:Flp pilus assembly protein TadD
MVDLGLTLAELSRREEAISVYRSAIAATPPEKRDVLIHAHYNLGIALRNLGRTEEAKKAFRAVLSLDPAHPGARAALESLGS